MVTFSRASIVVVPFPFSDLSGTKLRPAIVLGKASHDDWLLCQVTSQAYSDPSAIRITNTDETIYSKFRFSRKACCYS